MLAPHPDQRRQRSIFLCRYYFFIPTSPFALLNCYIYESVQENRSLTIKTKKKNMHDLVVCPRVSPCEPVFFPLSESIFRYVRIRSCRTNKKVPAAA